MPPLRKKRKNVIGARAKKKQARSVKRTRAAKRELPLAVLRRRAAELRRREQSAALQSLVRHEKNPILEPREDRFWEMKATFNPGAVYADRRVHLLYRAIGGDDVSVLGYASSKDGTAIDERSEMPAFVANSGERATNEKKETQMEPADLARIAYCSGGGWNGGCEDPRVTLLGDRIYLLYTAFDGWGSVRIALSSIGLNDFLHHKWKWKKSALISPPGEIHKNWVMFPEKVNGKFAILHSISPVVEIAYFDNLDELESGKRQIESHYDRISRTGGWDNSVRGAGPPPIKTKLGWLLFYHAMDMRDPNRYKVGAMVLDEKDPTKVLYRAKAPILAPDAHYENSGFKAGVVYACGAAVVGRDLYVYYGGGDTVTCVAMANLDTFLDELKRDGAPVLKAKAKK